MSLSVAESVLLLTASYTFFYFYFYFYENFIYLHIFIFFLHVMDSKPLGSTEWIHVIQQDYQ